MTPTAQDVTLERLEDQIKWYGGRSKNNQSAFKLLKIFTIAAAAMVPALAEMVAVPPIRWATVTLGVLIAVAEGVQQLYQFQSNWLTYRATSEALKHEKYLYLAKAGDYSTAKDPYVLLAERIESLVSQENTAWTSNRNKNERTPDKKD